MNGIAREIARIKRQASHLTEDLRQLENLLSDTTEKATKETEKEVILPEEMADILGKSVPTVRRWIKEGKLTPHYKNGRTHYWLRSELAQVLKSGSK
jgi:excisionase family DNA binding protein